MSIVQPVRHNHQHEGSIDRKVDREAQEDEPEAIGLHQIIRLITREAYKVV